MSADFPQGLAAIEGHRKKEAGNGGSMPAEQRKARPAGLLDLPDETLLHVYEILLSLYPLPERRAGGYQLVTHTGYLMPLPPILVNRRIFRIALPVRQRVIFLVERLPFLRSLAMEGGRLFGEHLFDPRSLAHLQTLDLCGLEPTWPITPPWHTLEQLRTTPRKGYFRDWEELVDDLCFALESEAGVRLTHLSIEVEAVWSERPSVGGEPSSDEEGVPALLEVFQQVNSLKQLELTGFENLFWRDDEPKLRLPSVKVLILEERLNPERCFDYNPHNHLSVLDFVTMLPSLSTLLLAVANLLSAETVQGIDAAALQPLNPSLPSTTSLVAGEPALQVLLTGLVKTEVINFRYRIRSDSPVELRFSREKGVEEVAFEGEWWWM
ncbi:hypothetical protein JCM11251_004206 [Rhodosporidiobolus azoricus]